MTAMVPVTVAPVPFAPAVTQIECREGLSIAEIVASVPELPPWFMMAGRVLVAGFDRGRPIETFIPREAWGWVRPKSGTREWPVVVSLLPPALGKGPMFKGNNLLMTIASIALIAGAAAISGGLLGPAAAGTIGTGLLGSSFAAGGLGANLAAAGLGIAGSLALRMLAPKPGGMADNGPQPVVAGISGNALSILGTVPIVLGKMRFSPPVCVRPWTTLENGSIWAHAVYCVQGRYDIQNLMINDTPSADETRATVITRPGASNDTALPSPFNITTVEDPRNEQYSEWETQPDKTILMDQAVPANSMPKWHNYRTAGPADEVCIRNSWPNGFNFQDNEQDFDPARSYFRIQIRRVGTSSWISLPTLGFQWKSFKQERQTIKLRWVVNAASFNTSMSIGINKETFACVAKFENVGGSFPYQTHAAFTPTILNEGELGNNCRLVRRDGKDGFIVYLPTATFPKGRYDIRIMRGAMARQDDKLLAANRYFQYEPSGGNQIIPQLQRDFTAQCYIESISTVENVSPLGFTGGFALIAIRAKELQIQSVSAEFTSVINVRSGNNWNTLAASRNAGEQYRQVLTGPLNVIPLSASLVNDTEILDMRATNNTCDAVVNGQTVSEVLQLIAGCAYAEPKQSETFGVWLDKNRSNEPIKQLITPLNAANFEVGKAFDRLPQAYRFEYYDETNDWQIDDDIRPMDGFTVAQATRVEGRSMDGFTSISKARKKALFDLRKLYLRPVTYTFEIERENLVANRGDLIGLSTDILSRTMAYAWIKSVTSNAGVITNIELEAAVDMSFTETDFFSGSNVFAKTDIFEGGAAGAVVIAEDGTLVSFPLNQASGLTANLIPSAVVADDGRVAPDRIIAIGLRDQEVRRVYIQAIDRADDLTARVTCFDEAPGIYA